MKELLELLPGMKYVQGVDTSYIRGVPLLGTFFCSGFGVTRASDPLFLRGLKLLRCLYLCVGRILRYPPQKKTQRFSSMTGSCMLDTRTDAIKTTPSFTFLFYKGLSNDVVGVSRGTTVIQEIRPGAVFKTGGFVREKLGGLPP